MASHFSIIWNNLATHCIGYAHIDNHDCYFCLHELFLPWLALPWYVYLITTSLTILLRLRFGRVILKCYQSEEQTIMYYTCLRLSLSLRLRRSLWNPSASNPIATPKLQPRDHNFITIPLTLAYSQFLHSRKTK